jgi:hypothetical protein
VRWAAKIGAKLVLSRLPVAYSTWKRLRLFQHGSMDSMDYAVNVFNAHSTRAGLDRSRPELVLCEIGPGDSLASALIGRCVGAMRTYLVDAGHFASTDMSAYRALAETLRTSGMQVPPDICFDSASDYLESCRAIYLTEGLRSMCSIESELIDMIWSHAVLEHVRSAEFSPFVAEMYRVTKPGGLGSHRVDLQDHLDSALNNLRFSSRLWESRFFASSGFYTNRLQLSKILACFRQAGFAVETPQVDRWSRLPTPRRSLALEFRELPDDELRVSGFDLVTKKLPEGP